MTVSSIGNRSVNVDTWTAQSAQEIKKLTNASGAINHFAAMAEVAKLQAGTVADSVSFSLSAAKAAVTLDMTLSAKNVMLAIKHATQAMVTFPAFVVPRLVLTTTQWLNIKGEDLPKSWMDRSRELALQICGSGNGVAKGIQANTKALTAVKVISSLAVLGGIGGFIASRFLSGNVPPPIHVSPNYYNYTIGAGGLLALCTFGLYAAKKCIVDAGNTVHAANNSLDGVRSYDEAIKDIQVLKSDGKYETVQVGEDDYTVCKFRGKDCIVYNRKIVYGERVNDKNLQVPLEGERKTLGITTRELGGNDASGLESQMRVEFLSALDREILNTLVSDSRLAPLFVQLENLTTSYDKLIYKHEVEAKKGIDLDRQELHNARKSRDVVKLEIYCIIHNATNNTTSIKPNSTYNVKK